MPSVNIVLTNFNPLMVTIIGIYTLEDLKWDKNNIQIFYIIL